MRKIFWTIGGLILLAVGMTISVPIKSPHIDNIFIPPSPIDSQVFITFSERMDTSSVQDAFYMRESEVDEEITGSMSWAGKTFVFTPDEPLEYNTQYSVNVTTEATSARGQEIQETWRHSFATHEHSFLFIGSEGEEEGILYRYFVDSERVEQVTRYHMFVRSFDYDPYSGKVVLMAGRRAQARDDAVVFYPYTLDLNDPLPTKMKPVRKLHTGDTFQYHYVRWIPFENTIVLGRTEVEEYENVPILSGDPSKTEFLKYNFDTKEKTVVRRGLSFAYPVSLTPDGRNIMYINEAGALAIYNITTRDEQLVASNFLEHYGFSEYGGYLMYTVVDSGDIVNLSNHLVLQSAEGENLHLFRETSAVIDHPAISPDEQHIVFKYLVEYGPPSYLIKFELGLLDLARAFESDGSVLDDIQILTKQEDGSIDRPYFSPDSAYISFNQFDQYTELRDPRIMWNAYEKKLIGAPIRIFNTANLRTYDTGQTGLDIQWIQ